MSTSTNALEVLDADLLFRYDEPLHKKLCDEKPWRKECVRRARARARANRTRALTAPAPRLMTTAAHSPS